MLTIFLAHPAPHSKPAEMASSPPAAPPVITVRSPISSTPAAVPAPSPKHFTPASDHDDDADDDDCIAISPCKDTQKFARLELEELAQHDEQNDAILADAQLRLRRIKRKIGGTKALAKKVVNFSGNTDGAADGRKKKRPG